MTTVAAYRIQYTPRAIIVYGISLLPLCEPPTPLPFVCSILLRSPGSCSMQQLAHATASAISTQERTSQPDAKFALHALTHMVTIPRVHVAIYACVRIRNITRRKHNRAQPTKRPNYTYMCSVLTSVNVMSPTKTSKAQTPQYSRGTRASSASYIITTPRHQSLPVGNQPSAGEPPSHSPRIEVPFLQQQLSRLHSALSPPPAAAVARRTVAALVGVGDTRARPTDARS